MLILLAAVILILVFNWGKITEWLEKSMMVEPPYPFKRGELDVFEAAPRPLPADRFRLVQADHGFSQRIVCRSTSASESPRLPTEGSMPASDNRSVYRIDKYWTPRSL